jgi:hypothetical protein
LPSSGSDATKGQHDPFNTKSFYLIAAACLLLLVTIVCCVLLRKKKKHEDLGQVKSASVESEILLDEPEPDDKLRAINGSDFS